MTEGPEDAQIDLLGAFTVIADGVGIDDAVWPGRRAVELVQILALSGRRELLRDHVIEAMWPHLDPVAGASNLRKAAHHARQALGDDDAVVLRRGSVALYPGREVVVDVDVYEQAATRALDSGDPALCSQAADLWVGDLLPGAVYEEWTQPRSAATSRWPRAMAAKRPGDSRRRPAGSPAPVSPGTAHAAPTWSTVVADSIPSADRYVTDTLVAAK